MPSPLAAERFGQCALVDATIGERLEACAALLHLHPGHLLAALFDAGIRIADPKSAAVLDAMSEIEIGVLECIRDGYSCAPMIFHAPCKAELARREAAAAREKKGTEVPR